MSMTDIIEETKEHIKEVGGKVLWIGSRDGNFAITEEEFNKLPPCEYNSDYGGQEIADDLVIVFDDNSFSERGEYDGSEWWTHNKAPIKKPNAKKFDKIKGGMWVSLNAIMDGE